MGCVEPQARSCHPPPSHRPTRGRFVTLILTASAIPAWLICAGTRALLPNPPVLSRVRNPEPHKGRVSATTWAKPPQTQKPLTLAAHSPASAGTALSSRGPRPPPATLIRNTDGTHQGPVLRGWTEEACGLCRRLPLERKRREGDQLHGCPSPRPGGKDGAKTDGICSRYILLASRSSLTEEPGPHPGTQALGGELCEAGYSAGGGG